MTEWLVTIVSSILGACVYLWGYRQGRKREREDFRRNPMRYVGNEEHVRGEAPRELF